MKNLNFCLLLTLIFVFNNKILPAQSKSNDSLINLYQNSNSEKFKFTQLKLFIQNFKTIQPDTLHKYATICLQLSEKFDSDSGRAFSNLAIGMSFQKQGNFTEAIKHYKIAKPLFYKVNHYEGLASSIYFNGVMYVFIGDYELALSDFFTALEVCEKNKLNARAADILIGIANVYGRLQQGNKCIEYNHKAIAVIESLPNIQYYSLVASYINLGGAYAEANESQKAISYLIKAIELANKNNYIDWQIKGNGNLATVYLQLKNEVEALKLYLLVVRLAEKIEDKISLSEAYLNLGNLYTNRNDKVNAERYFVKAIAISDEVNDVDSKRQIYLAVYKSLQKFGDYKNSLMYLEKHLLLNDSLLNANNLEQLNTLEAKYNTEKKEQQNKLLQKENQLQESSLKLQKTISIIVIISLVITLGLLIFIFSVLKKQRHANKIISLQKIEAETQKQKIEQHQKEILDSIRYAKRIQNALLPQNNYITKVLKNIKKG